MHMRRWRYCMWIKSQLKVTSHMSQRPWLCSHEDPWLSSKGRAIHVTDMFCRDLHQDYLLEMNLMQNLTNHETLSIIRHIQIHVLDFPSMITFLWTLGPSLSSVKWIWKNGTWTVLAFWTNGRSSHATVTGLQPSCVSEEALIVAWLRTHCKLSLNAECGLWHGNLQ